MGHDNWWTQKALFKELCQKYKVIPELDVAASDKNYLCEKYYTKEDNALEKSWYYQYHDYVGPADVWMNAPNSILKYFIRKAYDEWKEHNMTILSIMPCQAFASKAFMETIWVDYKAQGQIDSKVIIDPIFPRPVFLDGSRGGIIPENAAARSYMAVVLKHSDIKI